MVEIGRRPCRPSARSRQATGRRRPVRSPPTAARANAAFSARKAVPGVNRLSTRDGAAAEMTFGMLRYDCADEAGPMQIASSAIRACSESRSASE